MTVEFEKSIAVGKVTAPPSKSMAHRLLICAALAEGESSIHGVGKSDDVLATLDCLRALGVTCERAGDTVTVKGIDIRQSKPEKPLPCRESGSTLRFLIPLALLSGNHTMFSGAASLFRRPMHVYETLCEKHGLLFSKDTQSAVVKGPLTPGDYTVAGNISSQFISGLLFALPLLPKDSVLHILPPLESRPYITLTITALAAFGVKVVWEDDTTLRIFGNQRYIPQTAEVEGDYSGAAFLEALNYLGGQVEVEGLHEDSLQADRAYRRLFPMLFRGTPTIHIGDCPDLGPILFALAAAKNGAIFTGCTRLHMKESDRVTCMIEELEKFGTTVTEDGDSVVVYPSDFHAPREPLSAHGDHRIAMALSVLCSHTGGKVVGAEAASKSFPDFFEKIETLGISLTKTNE